MLRSNAPNPSVRSGAAPRCRGYAKPIPRNRLTWVVRKFPEQLCFRASQGNVIAVFCNEHMAGQIERTIAQLQDTTDVGGSRPEHWGIQSDRQYGQQRTFRLFHPKEHNLLVVPIDPIDLLRCDNR